jgi:heat shock protein HtpX
MPEVGIFDSPEVNAFATGMSKNSSLVAVSSGLLQQMTREEAEAVLGHEIAHIANGDMVTLALIQGVVNTFVMFLSRVIGYVVDKLVFKTERGTGPAFFVTMIIAEMVLGIFASMIVMWFSRKREFRADYGGAHLAGRENMIAALQRLNSLHPAPLPEKMAAFGIAGGGGAGIKRLFMTHPPLEERIAALKAAQ